MPTVQRHVDPKGRRQREVSALREPVLEPREDLQASGTEEEKDEVMDSFDRLVLGSSIVFAVLVIWLVCYAIPVVLTQSECLRLGYREANVDVFFNRYCVLRLDQTDIVVPIAEARTKPQGGRLK